MERLPPRSAIDEFASLGGVTVIVAHKPFEVAPAGNVNRVIGTHGRRKFEGLMR
jgi:hypothetical protein